MDRESFMITRNLDYLIPHLGGLKAKETYELEHGASREKLRVGSSPRHHTRVPVSITSSVRGAILWRVQHRITTGVDY